MAILTIAIGITAQSLVSYYCTLHTQNQRLVAAAHCRSLLSNMRALRDGNPNDADNPTHFQAAVLASYPEGAEFPGPATLRDSLVRISYEDPSISANPLVPTVQIEWRDLRGRPISSAVSSAVTDQ